MKPTLKYTKDSAPTYCLFGSVPIGYCFINADNCDRRDIPERALYQKLSDGRAVSLRSGSVCSLKDDTKVLLAKVEIRYEETQA